MVSATATEPSYQSVAANTMDIEKTVEANSVLSIPHSGLVMRLVSSFSGWSADRGQIHARQD